MGKPLISDTQLRTMHSLVAALVAAKRDLSLSAELSRAERFAIQRYPAALLAGLLPLLQPGDAVVTQGRNPLAERLWTQLSARQPTSRHGLPCTITACEGSAAATALVAAGAAVHQKSLTKPGGESRITLAILEKEDDLSECLRLAHAQLLPLLLVVRGENSTVTRARASRSLVPAIPVDDTDAVAVCRVMQESLIRARNGWSSVVIHALHTEKASDPIDQLTHHLRRRNLSLRNTSSDALRHQPRTA